MRLEDYFRGKKVAIAFSGGVDSAYLLYTAKKYADKCMACFIKSQFQPQFELYDAKKIALELNVDLKILELDILSISNIAENPNNRCYYCKHQIFSKIIAMAKNNDFDIICDGTNASDDISARPGMRALFELNVTSPLRMCGLTKDDIRVLSKEAGLFTHDKPSYACLATRIPVGMKITEDLLWKVEKSENILSEMGFLDFRVRVSDGALLQFKSPEKALEKKDEIIVALRKYFDKIIFDENPR